MYFCSFKVLKESGRLSAQFGGFFHGYPSKAESEKSAIFFRVGQDDR